MQPTTLDPDAVNLSKAIRQTESGGNFQAKGKSGEYGAYQYTAPTWKGDAAAVGINVPLNQATPEQQNQVAYTKIKALKDQGYNVGQIASIWNSGKPDAYLDPNYKGTNSSGANYDTPAYAKSVATAYQSIKQGGNPGIDPSNPSSVGNIQNQNPITGDQSQPSVGGFAQNVVKSGANLLGNVGNALLHPVQTIQNVGSAAVGGLQELGGQENDNTQTFDRLTGFFKDRYGGIDNLKHTLYTDPVGVAADISALLSGGAGLAGAVGKAGELAGATEIGTSVADAARATQGALSKASDITNPLTPVVSAGGALLNKAGNVAQYGLSQISGLNRSTIASIIENPKSFSSNEIANASRVGIAQDIESSLNNKIDSLQESGAGYNDIRQGSPIQVSSSFLENQLRDNAGVDVIDGQIIAKGSSAVRASRDVNALQQLFNTWKPEFQKGSLSPEEFLNFRQDLASAAKFDREFSASKPVEAVAAKIRSNLNTEYRSQIKGLEDKDSDFSSQKEELDRLRKGLIDKDGNLLETAINKIANAGGKGKDKLLGRLEEIAPGITQRLRIQKAIEDIHSAGENKVGTYAKALTPGGAVVALATGRLDIAAGAIATMILSNPDIAVPLLRLFGDNKELLAAVTVKLAKAVNLPAVLNRGVRSGTSESNPQDTSQQQSTSGDTQTQSSPQEAGNPSPSPSQNPSQSDITQTPGYQEAIAAGYTPEEIQQYLATQ